MMLRGVIAGALLAATPAGAGDIRAFGGSFEWTPRDCQEPRAPYISRADAEGRNQMERYADEVAAYQRCLVQEKTRDAQRLERALSEALAEGLADAQRAADRDLAQARQTFSRLPTE